MKILLAVLMIFQAISFVVKLLDVEGVSPQTAVDFGVLYFTAIVAGFYFGRF